jgi:hypothetical protein
MFYLSDTHSLHTSYSWYFWCFSLLIPIFHIVLYLSSISCARCNDTISSTSIKIELFILQAINASINLSRFASLWQNFIVDSLIHTGVFILSFASLTFERGATCDLSGFQFSLTWWAQPRPQPRPAKVAALLLRITIIGGVQDQNLGL